MKLKLPTFKHDCPQCRFLGSWRAESSELYDLYWCRPTKDNGIFGGSCIARYGDKASEYMSGDLTVLIMSIVNELAYGIPDMNNVRHVRKGHPVTVAAARALELCEVKVFPKPEME